MIYLVREHEGSYEDYSCYVIKAFSNKMSADKFIEQYNENLNLKIERSKKCENCPLYYASDEVKNQDLFIAKATKKCKDFSCNIKGNDIYMTCHDVLWDIPSVDTQEIGLED